MPKFPTGNMQTRNSPQDAQPTEGVTTRNMDQRRPPVASAGAADATRAPAPVAPARPVHPSTPRPAAIDLYDATDMYDTPGGASTGPTDATGGASPATLRDCLVAMSLWVPSQWSKQYCKLVSKLSTDAFGGACMAHTATKSIANALDPPRDHPGTHPGTPSSAPGPTLYHGQVFLYHSGGHFQLLHSPLLCSSTSTAGETVFWAALAPHSKLVTLSNKAEITKLFSRVKGPKYAFEDACKNTGKPSFKLITKAKATTQVEALQLLPLPGKYALLVFDLLFDKDKNYEPKPCHPTKLTSTLKDLATDLMANDTSAHQETTRKARKLVTTTIAAFATKLNHSTKAPFNAFPSALIEAEDTAEEHARALAQLPLVLRPSLYAPDPSSSGRNSHSGTIPFGTGRNSQPAGAAVDANSNSTHDPSSLGSGRNSHSNPSGTGSNPQTAQAAGDDHSASAFSPSERSGFHEEATSQTELSSVEDAMIAKIHHPSTSTTQKRKLEAALEALQSEKRVTWDTAAAEEEQDNDVEMITEPYRYTFDDATPAASAASFTYDPLREKVGKQLGPTLRYRLQSLTRKPLWSEVPAPWIDFFAQPTTISRSVWLQGKVAEWRLEPFSGAPNAYTVWPDTWAYHTTFVANLAALDISPTATSSSTNQKWHQGIVCQHLPRDPSRVQQDNDTAARHQNHAATLTRETHETLARREIGVEPTTITTLEGLLAFLFRLRHFCEAFFPGSPMEEVVIYVIEHIHDRRNDLQARESSWVANKAPQIIWHLKKLEELEAKQAPSQGKWQEAETSPPFPNPLVRYEYSNSGLAHLLVSTQPTYGPEQLPAKLQPGAARTITWAHQGTIPELPPRIPRGNLRRPPGDPPIWPSIPTHTNGCHHLQLRFLQNSPISQLSHLLTSHRPGFALSEALDLLGLHRDACANFHIRGSCSNRHCRRIHDAVRLPDVNVRRFLTKLQGSTPGAPAPAPPPTGLRNPGGGRGGRRGGRGGRKSVV